MAQTFRAEDGFVETSRADYPYHLVHAAGCGAAKRSKYGTNLTLDGLAERRANAVITLETHEACIPSGSSIWHAVHARIAAVRKARKDAERRSQNITSLAIIKVAAARLEKELGELTDEETLSFRRTEGYMYSGDVHASVSIGRAQAALVPPRKEG